MRLTGNNLASGIFAALCMAMLTPPLALAQTGGHTVRLESRAVFAWASPGGAAELRYPAPPGLVLDEVVDAASVGDAVLASFGSSAQPPELLFSIEPPFATSNLVVRYLLADGGDFRVELGAVEIAEVEPQDERALIHDRSLTATAATVYLATALTNVSDAPLSLTGVRYLPEPYGPGRLLMAITANPDRALARVEETLTPGNVDAWARGLEERPHPLVEGFDWTAPESLGQELGPGESVVLVWTGDAFRDDETPRSFRLRPIVEYALPDGSSAELGLPVPVRSEPTEDEARRTWNQPR